MKLINDLWTDENNNTWPADIGEAEAARRSATLVNCGGCRDCTDCADCTDCRDCRNCTDCTNCTSCTRCTRCTGFKSNPSRYAYVPIGSRGDTATAYWTSKEDLWIVSGCFAGTKKQFLNKVRETHGDNEHAVAYRWFAQCAQQLSALKPPVTTLS